MSKTAAEQMEALLQPDKRKGIASGLIAKPSGSTHLSTARSLLKYAGQWQGDDLAECLEFIYKTRSKIEC